MRRNCNLELELFPSRVFPVDRQNVVEENKESPQNHHHHHQQQLTILYNGRVSVCDATELQARAILMVANQEMKSPTGSEPDSPSSSTSTSSSQLYSPNSVFSMKRSLQRFLQKRNDRIQATSPYH